MFVDERQALIIEELQTKGRVLVKELSEMFSVSEDLIRKDLNTLEKAGKLKKMYGGAVPVKENVQRKLAAQRKNINTDSKIKIAKSAFDLICEGDVIFLDISTTSIELAKQIVSSNISVTVVTNMLDVINILVAGSVNAIFIGGEFDYGRDGFVGSITNEIITKFRFDKAFMGVVGVDIDTNSVMTYMARDGLTKQLIVSRSKEAYMLCEFDKFSQVGNYVYASMDDFSGIITDKKLLSAMSKKIKKYNVKVID